MERTTLNVSIIHFLLMFGFKLFSLFYPLYLVSNGLSLIKVGFVYLLINVTIALGTIGTNFWIHKINPAKAASAGIFGYGVYALLMLFNAGGIIFYAAQVLLGISAALWLVSLKSIIIDSRPQNYNKSFGWFYSAPEYASALAPAVGGLIIYKFGFGPVFALSVFIQFANAIWSFYKLRNISTPVTVAADKVIPKTFNLTDLKENYLAIFDSFKKDKVAAFALVVVFIALVFSGIHRPYFVLYLKELNYAQNDIIAFLSLISLVFIPLSWIAIRFISKNSSYKDISFGAATGGIIFIVVGLLSNFINLIYAFLLLLIDTAAGLIAGSGKSGMMAEKFSKFKEEASTIDTLLITLGPALGSIIGGMAISQIGFASTFLFGGMTVFIFSVMFYLFTKSHKARVPVISIRRSRKEI